MKTCEDCGWPLEACNCEPPTTAPVPSSDLVSRLVENWRAAADANAAAAKAHAAIYGEGNDLFVRFDERAAALRDCADHAEKLANAKTQRPGIAEATTATAADRPGSLE
jgi:hypothetical protein